MVREGIAFAKAERAGTAAAQTAGTAGKMLYRRGAWDTRQLLRQQSAAALAEPRIAIHGVSASTSPAAKAGQVVRCATWCSVEAAGFKVEKTGNDPNHYTVHMPENITGEISAAWNKLWK